MQFSRLSTLLFALCCFVQLNVFSAPLTIEIDHGIEAIPHETGDVDKNISSSFVQTIEASDIRDSQLDLSRIIENNSGIKIRRIGGLGSYSQISIRGKSSDQVKVYVDGMLINNASGGSVDLSQIPTNQIARIEIYKDVIPIEFSEASNGGVINIITHRASKQKLSQFRAGMGTFDTFNIGLNHFNHYNNWQFVFSGGYVMSKNNFSFNYENGTPQNPYDDEIQNRQNNELHQYNIVAKAKYNINKFQFIQYQSDLFKKIKNIPSFSNSKKTHTSLTYNNQFFNVKYINRHFTSKKLELNTDIKIRLKDVLYDDSEKQIGLVKRLIDQKNKALSGKIYTKLNEKNYQLVNNTSFHYEHLSYDDFYEPENTKSNNRIVIASALQGNFYFKNKKIIITPAGRFLFAHDSFNGETLNESPDTNKIRKTYYTTTSQIGMRYQYSKNTHLKFNAGKYYRLPSYVELFGSRGYIGSNETLLPEHGINLDAGFEHLSYPKSELLTKFNWNTSLYHSIINDEIVYSFNARGIGKPANNAKSTITGIENNISWELIYSIEIFSNTTLQLPLNRSDSNNIKFLAGRPPWSQTTRVEIDNNPKSFFFEHVWESFYYFDGAQRLPGKQKSVFNLGMKIHNKKVQYDFSINNLFSQQNKDFYYQVSPGLSIFFSANLTLT